MGLTKAGQKELPCSLLYDELGTALFEAITVLPEYGLTRAETRLLSRHANSIAGAMPAVAAVVELGSGNGSKTRLLLQALAARETIRYYPIDVSEYALRRCVREFSDVPGVSVHPVKLSYLDGLKQIASEQSKDESTLVLFLGSSIGNFHRDDAASFLREIRRELPPGDAFLLGADLDKPVAQLLSAYDDPAGVTAAFNLNLLGHINRVLGAGFDLRSFAHEARFNQVERRIEMHLRSKKDQVIAIPGVDLSIQLRRGETIWTESSYRYSLAELENLSRQTGFRQIGTWVDEDWPFASALWIVS